MNKLNFKTATIAINCMYTSIMFAGGEINLAGIEAKEAETANITEVL